MSGPFDHFTEEQRVALDVWVDAHPHLELTRDVYTTWIALRRRDGRWLSLNCLDWRNDPASPFGGHWHWSGEGFSEDVHTISHIPRWRHSQFTDEERILRETEEHETTV